MLAPSFAPLLFPFAGETLDGLTSSACGLWPDLRIGYVNPAWLSFGVANGAPPSVARPGLDANVLAAVPPILRRSHEALFARARDTGTVAELDYDCSTAEVHRTFRMRVHACESGAFVVVHSLLREGSHTARPFEALEKLYRDDRGFIVQCSNCRHVRRAADRTAAHARWDFVPSYVADLPPLVSHGLCTVCSDYFYP